MPPNNIIQYKAKTFSKEPPFISYEANHLLKDGFQNETLKKMAIKQVTDKKSHGRKSKEACHNSYNILASSEVVYVGVLSMNANYHCQYGCRSLNACKFHLEKHDENSTANKTNVTLGQSFHQNQNYTSMDVCSISKNNLNGIGISRPTPSKSDTHWV